MSYSIAVAPMMGYTDQHFRHLLRLLHPQLVLYTEMLTTNQILHANHTLNLQCDPAQHPLVLQIAGSEPSALARSVALAADKPYAAFNLNIGCPSPRLTAAGYGACLYKDPQRVAACVKAMQAECRQPVTVKTRIGVDSCDAYSDLQSFIEQVAAAGCDTFILHARKAWLKGLNPRQNRSVPTLNPSWVYQIKHEFPQLTIIMNGEIKTYAQAQQHLEHTNGIMLGRLCYQDLPAMVQLVHQLLPQPTLPSLQQAVTIYWQYVLLAYQQGQPLRALLKPLFACYHGIAGAKAIRQRLQAMASLTCVELLQQQIAACSKITLQHA